MFVTSMVGNIHILAFLTFFRPCNFPWVTLGETLVTCDCWKCRQLLGFLDCALNPRLWKTFHQYKVIFFNWDWIYHFFILNLIMWPKDEFFLKLWKPRLVKKTHNGEWGQNGEVVEVSIYFKEVFIFNYLILDHDIPMNRGNPIPWVLEYFKFFPFKN